MYDSEYEQLEKARFGQRLGAFLIDHVILSIVVTGGVVFSLAAHPSESSLSIFTIVMIATFFCLCLKDIIGGASIGKRALGLRVKCIDDLELQPSAARLFLRNILGFFWPLELIILLCSGDYRKIGDKLAGTDVYCLERNAHGHRRKAKTVIIVVAVVLAIAVFISAMVFGVSSILRNGDAYQAAIVYIEANEEIRELVGEVVSHSLVSGSLHTSGAHGNAEFRIRVTGEYGSVIVQMQLVRGPGGDWIVARHRR